MALNDPFDSKPREFLECESEEHDKAYREAIQSLRVLCFSGPFTGGSDDLLRWSHYADGHRGYCLLIRDPELLKKTRPVDYVNHYPDLADRSPGSAEFWDKVGFFKAAAWKYEDERRALFPKGGEREYVLPGGSIWAVAFGCWSKRDERREIARLVLSHSPQSYFFDAEIVKKSFSLNYRNATTIYRPLAACESAQ